MVRDQEGAALVEAALVLPILLLLVFGLTEFSLYAWNLGLARKAAELGVRRAILSDPVAVGPGLDPAESAEYWFGLPPGQRCFPNADGRSPCPSFTVSCGISGCRCTGDGCRFRFAEGRMAPILAAMRAVMPSLAAENVRITYATNGLGYVTRPGPVPVDVTVSLVGLTYAPLILGDLLGRSLPLGATARLPSEDLVSQ